MTETKRLFIAIKLPPTLQHPVTQICETLQQEIDDRDVRWIPTENLHLTLKFLGDTQTEKISDINNVLNTLSETHPPFSVTLENVGCFPNTKKPRVIWLGISDPKEHLLKLQKDVERLLKPLGYQPEKRPFSPHLTLGRVKRHVKRNLQSIGAVIESNSIGIIGDWHCDTMVLMQSDLSSSGAVYTPLHQVQLT